MRSALNMVNAVDRIPARLVLTRYANDCETGILSKKYDVRGGGPCLLGYLLDSS